MTKSELFQIHRSLPPTSTAPTITTVLSYIVITAPTITTVLSYIVITDVAIALVVSYIVTYNIAATVPLFISTTATSLADG